MPESGPLSSVTNNDIEGASYYEIITKYHFYIGEYNKIKEVLTIHGNREVKKKYLNGFTLGIIMR